MFSFVHNHILLGIELFDHYEKLWTSARIRPGISENEIRKIRTENGERIKEVQKMIFIFGISGFEYVAKEYHRLSPSKLGKLETRRWRIHLWDILKRSAELDLIEREQHKLWQGLLKFRNTIVHNNAISDTSEMYEYPKCKLELINGEMIKENPLFFPYLIDWTIDAIKEWILAIEK